MAADDVEYVISTWGTGDDVVTGFHEVSRVPYWVNCGIYVLSEAALERAREVAETIAHLASPEASYTTGASFVVDGGLLLMAAIPNQAALGT